MSSPQQNNPASIPPDLLKALTRFDREANDTVGRWLSQLENRPIPRVIYHYTTEQGLSGILESGKIWLTEISALNDPSELRHGITLATEVLNSEAMSGPEEYRLFANDFRDSLPERVEESAHYFVCSFSECGMILTNGAHTEKTAMATHSDLIRISWKNAFAVLLAHRHRMGRHFPSLIVITSLAAYREK